MVRSFRGQGPPPRRFSQRCRSAGGYRGISEGLEQESQTLRMDGDRRIHPGKAHSLSPDFGADPALLYQPHVQKEEATTANAILAWIFCKHYTSIDARNKRRTG